MTNLNPIANREELAKLQRLTIAPEQWQGEAIALGGEQRHYLQNVLRLQIGDRFIALDGRGSTWVAQLTPNGARAIAPLSVRTELAIALTCLVALPKGNGFDEIVRSGTELGATTFIPVLSDRTLLQPSTNKLERWRRIACEAAEQSERAIVPTIADPVPFARAIASSNLGRDLYLCVARRSSPHLLNCSFRSDTIALMTGPEGGWTDAEIESAIAAGWQSVSLGQRILRAVTAPLVALSLVTTSLECQSLTKEKT